MRRLSAFRTARRAVVAIYDSLLFLMVVVLVSEGMFLYTATVSDGGGDFDDDYYQHLADTGLIAIEGLSLNDSHPMPSVHWQNATYNETRPLDQWVPSPEADTVRWLLESYLDLTWRSHELPDPERYGEYNTSNILPLVNETFSENRLTGTDHAWLFLYRGEVQLFGSNSIGTVQDLPEERWASVSTYSFEKDPLGTGGTFHYDAELRYYLWSQ
jgi:hypothetical protein